jgi:PadR family transcriptional regulator PadR
VRRLRQGAVSVLNAVASGSRFGFDIMDATGLGSGSVYPTLERLEEQGLLRSRWEDARVAHREKRPPRRYFDLTPRGAEALNEGLARHPGLRPATAPGPAKRRA